MTDPRAPSPALETIQTKLAGGALDEAGALIDELLADFAGDPNLAYLSACLLYTSPSPRDGLLSRMPSSA